MSQKVNLKNRRNLNLSLLLDLPDGAGPFPGIVVLHGFTGFKEEEHIRDFALGLCEQGFVAVRFDASGFGESEGTIAGDFRVTNYISDIEDVLEYISGLKTVNSACLGICGHSLGGGLSVIAASRDERIQACCAVQPSALCREYSNDGSEWETTGWFEKMSEHPKHDLIRIPWEFAIDRMKFDAVDAAKKLSIPLMVMYGTADEDVPPQASIAIFDAARSSKELLPLEGYPHDFKLKKDMRTVVTGKLVDFFLQNLQAT